MPASGLKLRHRLASTDRQYRTHRTEKQKSVILQRFVVEGLQILFWAPSIRPDLTGGACQSGTLCRMFLQSRPK
jgi:hypothetical protein